MKNEERWKQRYYRQKSELKRLNRQIENMSLRREVMLREQLALIDSRNYYSKLYWDLINKKNSSIWKMMGF